MNKQIVKRKLNNYSVEELFNEYVYEKESNGLAKSSINNIKEAFYVFSHGVQTDVINQSTISLWVNKMLETKKPQTANKYLSVMRTFIYWLMDNDYVEPFKIKLIKYQEQEQRYFTDDEIGKLLNGPRKIFVDDRINSIIRFILATGARAATISDMHIQDINFKDKEISFMHTKNKKIQVIPLSPALEKELKKFIKTWETNSDYLYTDVSGNKLTPSAIRQALEKYCKKVGVKPMGPHKLRHSFARLAVKNGIDCFRLQKILGHSTIAMSQRYVNLYNDDLKTNYFIYSPLDKL